MGAVKTILVLVSNLMHSVRIRDAASKLGATAIFVESNDEMISKIREIHPSLLIIDLSAVLPDWEETVQVAKSEGVPAIAFGPHVDMEARQKAVEAGCDQVYANSKFTLELSAILKNVLSHS